MGNHFPYADFSNTEFSIHSVNFPWALCLALNHERIANPLYHSSA